MKCTARVTGQHRRATAAARCPVHRGENLRTIAAPAVAPNTQPTYRHSTQLRRDLIQMRRADVERTLIQAGLDAAVSRDFTGALADVAVALAEEASRRSKPSHWLCNLLADTAEAIDPSAIAAAMGDVFADALVKAGTPEWVASIAGWGIAKAAESSITALLPGAQLSLGLRVLALMSCPSPSGCPAGLRLSTPVLKAILDSPI